MTELSAPVRARRPPPPLQPVQVVQRVELSPRMWRFTFSGDGLRRLGAADPAASVRLLVPSLGTNELVIPTWNGNEFLLPDGERPALRTFTPLRVDRAAGRLDLEIVRHPGGAVSTWAETAQPDAQAAISGPGKGYAIESGVARYVLIGDETAIPAIADLLGALPADAAVEVHIEVESAAAEIPLPDHPGASVTWHARGGEQMPGARIVGVAQTIDGLADDERLWAAGEAAAMQAIRTHLYKTVGIPRELSSIRGYWKRRR